MELKNLGKGVVAGSLGLVGSLYSPPEVGADVVMRTEAVQYVSQPGIRTFRVGLDNTNHLGEVFSAEYILGLPLGLSSFFQEISRGPPLVNGFFSTPKFFEVIAEPGRLSGMVDSGVGVLNTNGFIAEYTFDTTGAPLGVYTLGLTHTNVYDHNVDLQPLSVVNKEFVFGNVGDVNFDTEVTIGDVSRLALNFGLPGGYSQGDLNGDGTVGIGDLGLMAEHFGDGVPVSFSGLNYSSLSSAVPLPSAGLMGGLGLACLSLIRRKGKLESRV